MFLFVCVIVCVVVFVELMWRCRGACLCGCLYVRFDMCLCVSVLCSLFGCVVVYFCGCLFVSLCVWLLFVCVRVRLFVRVVCCRVVLSY